jgi:hypothetical protein
MFKATYSVPVVISTVGQADLHEDVIFSHRGHPLQIGDLVDLRVTKPKDAPVYGQARITGYEGYAPQGYPTKFKAIRIV